MMSTFPVVSEWRATGRARPRVGLFGKILVQVEEERSTGFTRSGRPAEWGGHETRWRDARQGDVIGPFGRVPSDTLADPAPSLPITSGIRPHIVSQPVTVAPGSRSGINPPPPRR